MTDFLRILLESSVRISLAAALVGLALMLARVRASAVLHAAWTGVLCAMLLMPVLPYVVPPLALPTPARVPAAAPQVSISGAAYAPSQAAVAASAAALSLPVPGPVDPLVGSPWWPLAALAVYFAGVLFFLARFVTGWLAMRRVIRASAPISVQSETAYESPFVATPLTAGVLAPKVLLPRAWRTWPERKLRVVLAHELAHVERGDTLTTWLAHWNRCLFWFHPLAWWLERKLALTAEHAADEAGVRAAGESRTYAEMLLEMAEAVHRNGARLAWQGVGVGGPGLLGRRIDRIQRGGLSPAVSRTRKAVVALGCVLAIMVAAACRQRSFSTGDLKEDPKTTADLARQKAEVDSAKAARELSERQVADLEALVKRNPEDLDARKKLMTCYQYRAQQYGDQKATAAFRAHKLWFIEHHPENELAVRFNPQSDPAGDQQAGNLWLAQIARPDAPAGALSNAAMFFSNSDKPLTEKLLLRGQAADPSGDWTMRRGMLYASVVTTDGPYAAQVREELDESNDPNLLFRVAQRLFYTLANGPHANPDAVALAKSYLDRALKLDPNLAAAIDLKGFAQLQGREQPSPGSMLDLARMGERAYVHGNSSDYYNHDAAAAKADWESARKYAQQALDLASKSRGDADYGTAIYRANMTLGMVAMRVDGNKKAAARYLLEASKAPATDELAYNADAFTVKLPVVLLKYGGPDEREAVIEYLERFGKVLHRRDLPLLENAAELRKGYMPLWYQYQVAELR